MKPNSIPEYFDAILNAQAPERFSLKFLENLGFSSTNDRLLIGILKDLGFLNSDGAPQQRYFEFLDRSQSKRVLADAIREAYSDLFAVNVNANALNEDDVRNKLRTLYAGKKTDQLIGRIAKTFSVLCEYADFSKMPIDASLEKSEKQIEPVSPGNHVGIAEKKVGRTDLPVGRRVEMGSLQYHVNIVLPESRDQAVYDAIFKSLREHLG